MDPRPSRPAPNHRGISCRPRLDQHPGPRRHQFWNFDNSNGKTHETGTKSANPAGFFDLLGNVAEGLAPPPGYDDDIAPLVGGTAQTQVDNIRAAPLAKTDITSRNPFTGFRFVVDTDDSIPVMPAALPPAATN